MNLSSKELRQPEQKPITEQIKEKLVITGIKNLNEFGYPDVTKETILTDEIYKEFFKSMLNDNKGNGSQIDKAIDELLVVVACH